jgi:hypothetical protein
VMEGRGSDGGGGNGGAGPLLLTMVARRLGMGGRHRPYVLIIRQWALVVVCGALFVGAELSFVGGGACSGCWALFVGTGRCLSALGVVCRHWALFVGAGFPFVGCGACSRAVHVRGWVHGQVVHG